jgi:hypothetical protein
MHIHNKTTTSTTNLDGENEAQDAYLFFFLHFLQKLLEPYFILFIKWLYKIFYNSSHFIKLIKYKVTF